MRALTVITFVAVASLLAGCATEPAEIGGLRTVVFDRPITWFGWATILSVVFYLVSRPGADPLENSPFMREVHAWSRWLATVLVPLYVLGWILAPTQVYTFRVTVDVDVNGERKTGSSVLEVIYTKGWARWFMRPNPDFGTGASLSFRGTAPIVDLGKYGTLFPSLKTPLYKVAYDGEGGFDLGPRRIPEESYNNPTFVVIPPDDNPDEALQLGRKQVVDHFGGAVRVADVRIAPTDDPVRESLENIPEWLKRTRGRTRDFFKNLPPQTFVLFGSMVQTGDEPLQY